MNTSKLSFQKSIAVLVMVVALLFGTMAFATPVKAESNTPNTEILVMLQQIQSLMDILSQLQARVEAMKNSGQAKSPGQNKYGYRLVKEVRSIKAGESETIATIKVPAGDGDSNRYLNRAKLSMVSKNDAKPWESFSEIIIRDNGFRIKTIDASDRSNWGLSPVRHLGGFKHAINLHDNNQSGYGVRFNGWSRNITIEVTASPEAAKDGSEKWTMVIPDNGVSVWAPSTGNIYFGGQSHSVEFTITGDTDPEKLGERKMYFDGELRMVSEDITESEAYSGCLLNASLNPSKEVHCTWDGKIIFDNRSTDSNDDGADEAPDDFWSVGSYLNVFGAGVYEGTNSDITTVDGGNRPGIVNVEVADGYSDTMLVLTAYEPVTWNVSGAGKDLVTKVFLSGYYDQDVIGLDSDVEVVEQTYEGGDRDYFYFYQKDDNYDELIDYLEDKTGVRPYNFEYGYKLEDVRIGWKG